MEPSNLDLIFFILQYLSIDFFGIVFKKPHFYLIFFQIFVETSSITQMTNFEETRFILHHYVVEFWVEMQMNLHWTNLPNMLHSDPMAIRMEMEKLGYWITGLQLFQLLRV